MRCATPVSGLMIDCALELFMLHSWGKPGRGSDDSRVGHMNVLYEEEG